MGIVLLCFSVSFPPMEEKGRWSLSRCVRRFGMLKDQKICPFEQKKSPLFGSGRKNRRIVNILRGGL